MQQIIPHLWFDKNVSIAVEFYISVFPESKLTHTTLLRNTPSGDCPLISFELWRQEFMALGAGPEFRINPSVSFIVNFDLLFFDGSADAAQDKLDMIWGKLSDGGKVLMPLQTYPFSKHYGWVQDRYGVSWQLMLTDPQGDPRPPIVPSLLFTGNNAGKAEEAINFYCATFRQSQHGALHRYPEGMEPDHAGTITYGDCKLQDRWFAAMDSAREHGFTFNEAVSFIVNCDDQQEIDYYWSKLSAVPEAEQCGWIKDQYGISWQITPAELEELMRTGTQDEVNKLTQALMPMKKISIAQLKAALGKG